MSKKFFAFIIHLIMLSALTACGVGAPSVPSAEKIKGDLLGKVIGNPLFGGPSWKFDSMSEFEEFKVLDTKKTENIIEYKVETKLKGASGSRYAASLSIVYRLEAGEWKIVNLTDNYTLKKI